MQNEIRINKKFEKDYCDSRRSNTKYEAFDGMLIQIQALS